MQNEHHKVDGEMALAHGIGSVQQKAMYVDGMKLSCELRRKESFKQRDVASQSAVRC